MKIKREIEVKNQAKMMKIELKDAIKHYLGLKNRFKEVFGTEVTEEIVEKYKDVMMRGDLLQKNVEHLLIEEAKLRKMQQRLQGEWKKLLSYQISAPPMQSQVPVSISPISPSTGVIFLSEALYHWVNNLTGLVTQISRADVYSELSVKLTGEGMGRKDEVNYVVQLCLILEKQLKMAEEVMSVRNKVKVRKRKQMNSTGNTGEERNRMKKIAEQHFGPNPSEEIQALIGGYASALQKEVNNKQMNVKLQRQVTKVREEEVSLDQGESEFLRNTQLAAKTSRPELPSLEALTERVHGVSRPLLKPPLTDRHHESSLRTYISTRSLQLRKSSSTEGLEDFLKDLQIRKRDLARFIDKHRKQHHLRGFSQASESGLEGSHKRTVSSLTSTCPSAAFTTSSHLKKFS